MKKITYTQNNKCLWNWTVQMEETIHLFCGDQHASESLRWEELISNDQYNLFIYLLLTCIKYNVQLKSMQCAKNAMGNFVIITKPQVAAT